MEMPHNPIYRLAVTDRLWRYLCDILPQKPTANYVYWYHEPGQQIMSESGEAIDLLANLFDDLYGEGTCVTGYDNFLDYYFCANC